MAPLAGRPGVSPPSRWRHGSFGTRPHRVLDRGLMKRHGRPGLHRPELPEAVGGLGLGCLAAGVIHEEIARADLSLSYLNLLASLNGQILSEHGRPEVVAPWLARLTAARRWSPSR